MPRMEEERLEGGAGAKLVDKRGANTGSRVLGKGQRRSKEGREHK
jgi:hypothetical protein